ncbi:MAG: hypothetical protein AAF682_14790 [Planctomycetota bacterium]
MQRNRAPLLPILAFVTVVAGVRPASAQAVWRVDPGGEGDFLELQEAIDAAADGDVIVVEQSTHAPIRIVGKGLRIHAASTFFSVFNEEIEGVEGPAVLVADLAPTQSVVIDRLQSFSGLPFAPSAMRVENCAGPVFVHAAFLDSYGGPALHVLGSDSVVLTDCVLQTNVTTPALDGEPQPGPGALVEGGSRLFGYDVSFLGSHGPFVLPGLPAVSGPQDGGDGLTVIDSTVVLQGGDCDGGSGSTFFSGGCVDGGDGGAGIRLVGTGLQQPVVRFTATQFSGGSGGFTGGCGTAGVAGPQIEPGPGDVINTFQDLRLVDFEAGLSEPGEPVRFTATGKPGDLVFVFASSAPAVATTLPTGFLFGEVDLHITPAPFVAVVSDVLAGPSELFEVPAPAVPPGVAAATVTLQGVMIDGVFGFPHSSAPSALTIVEP